MAAGPGDVPALVRQLRGNKKMAQLQALKSLKGVLDAENVRSLRVGGARPRESLPALLAAGGVPVVLHLLRTGGEAVQEEASGLLQACCGSEDTAARAIFEAGGVPLLVERLSSGRPYTAEHAARVLGMMITGLQRRVVLHADIQQAAAAAGAIFPLARLLEGGGDEELQSAAAMALSSLALGSPSSQQQMAEAGCIPAAVRLLRRHVGREGGDLMAAGWAARLLHNLGRGSRASCHEMAAEGAVALLLQLAGSRALAAGQYCDTAVAALHSIATSSPACLQEVAAKGGVTTLVRLLRAPPQGCDTELLIQMEAAFALGTLAASSDDARRSCVAAGAVPAMAALLCELRSASDDWQLRAVGALAAIGRGQWAAFEAAGGSSALEQLGSGGSEQLRSAVAAARQALQPAAGTGAAAEQTGADPSSSGQAAGQAPTAANLQDAAAAGSSRRSPARVCAAPGCGATTSLRRCGGCGAVRYCGEACCKAHWRAHKADCRRLQAEQAAASAAAPQGGDQ